MFFTEMFLSEGVIFLPGARKGCKRSAFCVLYVVGELHISLQSCHVRLLAESLVVVPQEVRVHVGQRFRNELLLVGKPEASF
jgi:hypothetical protein